MRREFGDFSRASQAPQLAKLNEFAHSTYCTPQQDPACVTHAARPLIEHWYRGNQAVIDGVINSASFDDSVPPPGWRNEDRQHQGSPGEQHSAEDIYHVVYAQHCRMCHTNIEQSNLRFHTYDQFRSSLDVTVPVAAGVFERGVMPAARLTYDRFWTAHGGSVTAAQTLAEHLGVEAVDGRLGPQPHAEIQPRVVTASRDDTVRLSAGTSLFAESFAWSVDYEPPTELLGNPEVALYQPSLLGASTSQLLFSPAKPGRYTVNLTINDGIGVGTTSDAVEFVVANFTPAPVALPVLVAAGASRTVSVLDRLNEGCVVTDCPEVFGDAPFSIALNTSVWNPSTHGVLTVQDAATGTFTIEATRPAPISVAIPYSITDADLETVGAVINVTVEALADPVAESTSRSIPARTTLDTALGRSVSIEVEVSTHPDAAPGRIREVTGAPANGEVTIIDERTFRYTPDLFFIGTDTFRYIAEDSNPAGERTSAEATITITVNPTVRFSSGGANLANAPNPPNVQAAFSNATCLDCHGAGTDWTVYANVLANTEPPANAEDSPILKVPTSDVDHPVGAIDNWTTDNANYRTVQRWIEEGRRDN